VGTSLPGFSRESGEKEGGGGGKAKLIDNKRVYILNKQRGDWLLGDMPARRTHNCPFGLSVERNPKVLAGLENLRWFPPTSEMDKEQKLLSACRVNVTNPWTIR